MIRRVAHAKINLALHVTGQREDGYHLLDSLVVFSEFGDFIEVGEPHHAHGPLEVSVNGCFGDSLSSGAENLVTSAALLLLEAVKRSGHTPRPVSVKLTKNLPIASGIGGGSADAAATLLALQQYWQSDVDLVPIANGLGADVPMCLISQTLRAGGIGEKISIIDSKTRLNLVLVNPGIEISTPEVFGRLDRKDNEPIAETDLDRFPSIDAMLSMRNDLQGPAQSLQSSIDDVLEAISGLGSLLTRMSGSGATCFGIFETIEEAESACRQIMTQYPDWWCVATRTVAS
ncbi:MAG: 4-(cytidine 5'-diphospho)-2-C-methyl-D-erythritol kinase [Pseudomonadota bacterium]